MRECAATNHRVSLGTLQSVAHTSNGKRTYDALNSRQTYSLTAQRSSFVRLARTEGVGSVEAQNVRYPDAAKGQARHIGKRARRLAGPDIEFVIWLKSLILRAQSLILPSDSLILSQGPLILTTAVLISRPAAARSSASSLPLSPWAHVMHDGLGPAWHAWRATMIVIAASTVDGDGGGIHQLIFLAYPDLQRLGTFGVAKAPKNNPPSSTSRLW